MRLAEQPQHSLRCGRLNQLAHLILRQSSRFRNARDLEQRGGWCDVRVKPARGGGEEIDRDRRRRVLGSQFRGIVLTRSTSVFEVGATFEPPELAAL